MPIRSVPRPRFDPLLPAIVLATAAVIRAVLGYRPFPSVDDFTYIPLGQALLDPELFPRDEILRGYLNHVQLWPGLIWILERTLGLAQGLFLLTILLTVQTVLVLRQLLRSLQGSDLFLPVVVLFAVVVKVRGLGRGAFDGVLGDAFHMQWLALVLVLMAYAAFVRSRGIRTGVYLGLAAWVHPLVASHGAFCVALSGLLNWKPGLVDVLKAGITAVLVSLPLSISLLRGVPGGGTALPGSASTFLDSTLLFRAPHHYDLKLQPFLAVALLGLLALAAYRRHQERGTSEVGRFYGILAGQVWLLSLTFFLHGPVYSGGRILGLVWPYLLDLSRSTPLFLALCGVAVVAALPGPGPTSSDRRRTAMGDRALLLSSGLAAGCLLLINLRHDLWVYVLFVLFLLAVLGARRGWKGRPVTVGFYLLALAASADFLVHAEPSAQEDPDLAALHSWARAHTGNEALFIIPPGLQSFRLGAGRSVYVDFKSFPPSQPTLALEWRRRLEEVANPDAKALEQGRGWEGLYWWDLAYAKRNPPQRIAELLAATDADFFVIDRLYQRLPPHLPGESLAPDGTLLRIVFQNDRYQVVRRERSE